MIKDLLWPTYSTFPDQQRALCTLNLSFLLHGLTWISLSCHPFRQE